MARTALHPKIEILVAKFNPYKAQITLKEK